MTGENIDVVVMYLWADGPVHCRFPLKLRSHSPEQLWNVICLCCVFFCPSMTSMANSSCDAGTQWALSRFSPSATMPSLNHIFNYTNVFFFFSSHFALKLLPPEILSLDIFYFIFFLIKKFPLCYFIWTAAYSSGWQRVVHIPYHESY